MIRRRALLRNGLGGLASAVASPLWSCGGGSSGDGARRDAGVDAGPGAGAPDMGAETEDSPFVFPARDVPTRPPLRSRIAEIGPLGAPDENGVRLADGFSSRVLARARAPVADTGYMWPVFPDGGAVFATEDGGWIYACNSELLLRAGVSALRFDASGTIADAYSLLTGTRMNCAGGPTPWHTWLSCEETADGQVYETDPWGEAEALVRPALGSFRHEAVTVDPVQWQLYLTEDEPDGRFYRFTPEGMNRLGFPELSRGRLEVAAVDAAGGVSWLELPDPLFTGDTPTRSQRPESTAFDGGEGIWWHNGIVYFSTKGTDRVHAYNIADAALTRIYDASEAPEPTLRGVDNLTVSCCGDVLVAEDGGSMQIVAILPSGEAKPLLQVMGQDASEITGPAFDPSGTRLYFSSQRGDGSGITYEVAGPFHTPA